MTLEAHPDMPGGWRLETDITRRTVSTIEMLQPLVGVSLTELIRRSIGILDVGLETEFANGRLWVTHKAYKTIKHDIVLPETLPVSQEPNVHLGVNLNQPTADVLRNAQLIKGYEEGETIDRAVDFFGRFVEAGVLGGVIRREMNGRREIVTLP